MNRSFRSIVVVCLLLLSGASLVVAGPLRSKSNKLARRSATKGGTSIPGQSATLMPDGRLLLLGGEGPNGPVPNAAMMDPKTGSMVDLSNGLRHPRTDHTATLLPDGTVLVFGGVGSSGRIEKTAELFDPTSQKFADLTLVGLTPRAFHTATLLTDGQVVVAGGVVDGNETVANIEMWDFRTRTGSDVPTGLLSPTSRQTATLMPDGTVLFWGGMDNLQNHLSYGELFDPVTERVRMETVPLQQQIGDSAPQLAASSPENGAANVAADALIALRFSTPVQVTSVNVQTVKLTSDQGLVSAKVTPAEGGMLAFLLPASSLSPGTTYTLSVSGVTDRRGSILPDSLMAFTTTGASSGVGGAGGFGSSDPDDNGAQAFNSSWRKLPPLEAAPGVTAVAGQALRLNGLPLKGVTLTIGDQAVRTDDTGRFLLANVSSGRQVMVIDGSTANEQDRTYGVFEDGVNVVQGQTYALPYTIWMTRLDTKHAASIPSPTVQQDTVITTPLLPGLELHLPASTVIYGRDGKVVRKITISPVPVDKPPFPLPAGVRVPIYFTIQPGGAYLKVQNYTSGGPNGARLIYPNSFHLPAGTQFDFWNYDADQKGWYVYGHGKVSPNGQSVVPDPGVEIYEFTGAMVGTPNGAPATGPTDKIKCCEPVDLSTGLFVYDKIDLALSDVMPLILQRTYRTNDSWSRPFGIGATQYYEMFIVGDENPYTYQELILPDGSRIHFYRTSSGTDFNGAVYAHTSTHTKWYGATITFNNTAFPGAAWILRTRDGTNLYFPDSNGLTNPAKQALIAIQDRNGNTITITRDTNGNVTNISSPNGRFIAFQHDTSNRITEAQDNIGRTVLYTYDTTGRLSTVTDAAGGITTYTYDSNNNMLTIEDARGIVYLTNQFDSGGRVTKQTLADGSTYQIAWTLTSNTGQAYSIAGGLPPGGTATAVAAFRSCPTCSEGYTPLILQADITDPRGIVRELKFGTTGQLSSDTYALGKPEQRTYTYAYYADNLIQSITDQLGRVTNFSYDANGNTIQEIQLFGTSNAVANSFGYDTTFSQLTSAADPLGHTTSFTLDVHGNTTVVSDPLNHQTTLTYDSQGRPTSVTDPLNDTKRLQYVMADISTITDAVGRTVNIFHDSAGRLVSASNPLGQITRVTYNPLNQVTVVTDPLGGQTSFSYDANGNLLSLTDALNHATVYTFDSMDRLATRKDPLLRVESYQYDGNGNLTQSTDRRGKITTFTYDNLDRVSFVGFNTLTGPTYDSTVNLIYDSASRLTQTVDSASGTISRAYDGLNRLTTETTPQGVVNYSYDAANRRTTMTAGSQPTTSYTYDNADRLTQIVQGAANVSFGYDGANRRTSVTLPNGIVMSYGYDGASELTSLAYQLNGSTLGNLVYTYDLASRRIYMGGTYARTGLPNPISTASYDASNELTQWGTATPTYDANGNALSDGTNSYVWDARNQLASMNLGGATFQYDSFGRRVNKTVIGTTTNFLYDGANPVQELSGGSTTANLLTSRIDEYFQRTDSAGSRNFLTDGLGSSLALTDSAGTTQTQYTYDPFGNSSSTGSSASSYEFTGRENDGTGVYFFRARYYDPTLQRFISEDPARMAGGDVNFYAYVRNDPTSLTDPSGLSPMSGRGSCQPQCFAQLKYRPVDDWRVHWTGATHSFWYVQGSSGVQYIVSAGPSNTPGNYLNIWPPSTDLHSGVDNVSAATDFDSGLSADNCAGVDKLLTAARGFGQYDNYYSAFWGPNSNSAANYLGSAGGFSPPAPLGGVGWYTGVMP